jgi:hypothetical protein
MSLGPALRKLTLTAHVTSSVGWLGAVAGFLALSIAGMTSGDAGVVRGAYLAMNVVGLYVIVPLGLAAMATGLVQSLGTPWGLFRHYWVIVKFVLGIGATVLLLLHQFTAVAGAATRAGDTPIGAMPDVGGFGTQLVVDAALAIVVLLIATTLSIYKPWGKTRLGRRTEQTALSPAAAAAAGWPMGLKIFVAVVAAAVVAFLAIHLAGGGLSHHGG